MKVKQLPIHLFPSKSLTKRCTQVKRDYAVLELVAKLRKTLKETKGKGLGIAACQVGILKRVFIHGDKVFINPVLMQKKGAERRGYESCLSLPNIEGRVNRHQKIVVEYYDENWDKHVEKLRKFDAIIFQHELDHLNGKIITQHFDKKDSDIARSLMQLLSDGHTPLDLTYDTCYQHGGTIFKSK